MIIGIGTDTIEIEKIKRNIDNLAYLSAIFHNEEIQVGKQKADAAQYFAGRFAAKESLRKAAENLFKESFPWNSINIFNEPNGKPSIKFYGDASSIIDSAGSLKIHLSISHCETVATAVVIIEM